MKREILSRLAEPSSWAGLAALASLAIPPEAAQGVGQIVAGVFALLAVFLPERPAQ